MAQGTITRLASRGFGFIDYGSAVDVFFHSEVLENVTFTDLHKGDQVEFDLEEDTRGRGPRAGRVSRIDD